MQLKIADPRRRDVPAVSASQPKPRPRQIRRPAARPAFDKADAEQAVTELATALEENFVFPDQGKAYAAMLRANLEGRLCELPRCSGLRREGDRRPPGGAQGRSLAARRRPGRAARAGAGAERRTGRRERRCEAGWLAPGVAYIEFTGFPGSEATLAEVRKFLAAHKDAKTLIIDARNNGGGGLAEMNLVFAQIFAKPTTLVDNGYPPGGRGEHGTPFDANDPLMRRVSGPATIIRREHAPCPAQQSGLKDAKVIS